MLQQAWREIICIPEKQESNKIWGMFVEIFTTEESLAKINPQEVTHFIWRATVGYADRFLMSHDVFHIYGFCSTHLPCIGNS